MQFFPRGESKVRPPPGWICEMTGQPPGVQSSPTTASFPDTLTWALSEQLLGTCFTPKVGIPQAARSRLLRTLRPAGAALRCSMDFSRSRFLATIDGSCLLSAAAILPDGFHYLCRSRLRVSVAPRSTSGGCVHNPGSNGPD